MPPKKVLAHPKHWVHSNKPVSIVVNQDRWFVGDLLTDLLVRPIHLKRVSLKRANPDNPKTKNQRPKTKKTHKTNLVDAKRRLHPNRLMIFPLPLIKILLLAFANGLLGQARGERERANARLWSACPQNCVCLCLCIEKFCLAVEPKRKRKRKYHKKYCDWSA